MKQHTPHESWTFRGPICDTFEGHIRRSVPFYDEGHELIVRLSTFFLSERSLCYDLGCSTGLLLHRLAGYHANRDIRFVGIEREADMVDKAVAQTKADKHVRILHHDLVNAPLEKADLIIAYYTLQFVPPKYRQTLIDRLYESLNWGGALVMFEKVRGADARFQDIATQLYTEYKQQQGHCAEDILTKAEQLKGVLEPFSTQGNLDLLKRAGFVDVTSVMKYICFEGFLAIK